MIYSAKIVEKANNVLSERRKQAEAEAQKKREELIDKHPEFGEIEFQLAQSGLDAVKSLFDSSNPKEYIKKLKRQNLQYQKAKEEMLKSYGHKADYLEPKYSCSACNDTGFVNGKICKCYEELLNKISYEELSNKTSLQISSFDDFNCSLYKVKSDREKMQRIFNFCKTYSKDFGLNSDSLFMYGETGLGKTHLSLAIAGEAINKGFNVVYGSAQNLFSMIERERFGRSDNPDGTTEDKLINCDLLVLDDLGSEFTTQFTIAELFNIIDTRISKDLPTIVNSNISLSELENRYNNRIASRFLGCYKIIHFVGNDIRQAISQED